MLPILGANDGASGISILLSIAEILHTKPLKSIGIDLLFVDDNYAYKSITIKDYTIEESC